MERPTLITSSPPVLRTAPFRWIKTYTVALGASLLIGPFMLGAVVLLAMAGAAVLGISLDWMQPQSAHGSSSPHTTDGYYLGLPVWLWNGVGLVVWGGLLFSLWRDRKLRREAPDEGRFLGNDYGPSYAPVESRGEPEDPSQV